MYKNEDSRLGIARNPNLASMDIYNGFFVIEPEPGEVTPTSFSGRTSYDENHSHEFAIDGDRTGSTSWVYRSETQEIGHKHEIVNGIILEAQSDCWPNCKEQFGFAGAGPHSHDLPAMSVQAFNNNTVELYESGFEELEYSRNVIIRQHDNYSGMGSLFGSAAVNPNGSAAVSNISANQTSTNFGSGIPSGGMY